MLATKTERNGLTKSELFFRLDLLLAHLLDLVGKHDLGLGRAVDTVGLDRDQDTTAHFQEQVSVQAHDSGLIRLRNVGKDDVDHADEHAVAERVTSVLDDGDDVCAVCSHGDQITA